MSFRIKKLSRKVMNKRPKSLSNLKDKFNWTKNEKRKKRTKEKI